MIGVNIYRAGSFSVLLAVVLLCGRAQFLPSDLEISAAQVVGGVGTCTCCSFYLCSGLGTACGTNSYAISNTGRRASCNCNISTTNPCGSGGACDGRRTGTGNDCTTC